MTDVWSEFMTGSSGATVGACQRRSKVGDVREMCHETTNINMHLLYIFSQIFLQNVLHIFLHNVSHFLTICLVHFPSNVLINCLVKEHLLYKFSYEFSLKNFLYIFLQNVLIY